MEGDRRGHLPFIRLGSRWVSVEIPFCVSSLEVLKLVVNFSFTLRCVIG